MTRNHCESCKHKQENPDGGHCYMFRYEPQGYCTHHTNTHIRAMNGSKASAQRMLDRMREKK